MFYSGFYCPSVDHNIIYLHKMGIFFSSSSKLRQQDYDMYSCDTTGNVSYDLESTASIVCNDFTQSSTYILRRTIFIISEPSNCSISLFPFIYQGNLRKTRCSIFTLILWNSSQMNATNSSRNPHSPRL